jgi:hypothetical protein
VKSASSRAVAIFVVNEIFHYKTVDERFSTLHDAAISPIGSSGKSVVTKARLTAELFPDVYCPQGRLMKLTWHGRPLLGRETPAINPQDACGRAGKSR